MAERPLTVVQILPALGSGGVEQGTLEVADELVRRGHRSVVISGGGRMVPRLTDGGSEHLCWRVGEKSLTTLQFIPRLHRLLRRQRVDILHARSRLPAWIALAALQGLPARHRPHFVTTVHGLYSVKRYSAIMTRGERVIAVSDTVRRYILTHYPATQEADIQLIYRGVDCTRFTPEFTPSPEWIKGWHEAFPQTRGKRLLVLPGRITRLKGHADFIPLFAELARHHPDLHALIVGGEDPKRRAYARSIHQLVAQHQLCDRITFTGVRDDIRELFSLAEIVFSLSSHPESFGRTVLEALSLGTPVIGYQHGGVAEILTHLLPAGSVPPGDRDALLDTSLAFLKAPPSPRPNRRFSTARMLDETLALYHSLCHTAA